MFHALSLSHHCLLVVLGGGGSRIVVSASPYPSPKADGELEEKSIAKEQSASKDGGEPKETPASKAGGSGERGSPTAHPAATTPAATPAETTPAATPAATTPATMGPPVPTLLCPHSSLQGYQKVRPSSRPFPSRSRCNQDQRKELEMGHLAPGGECVRYDVGVAVVMAQIIVRAASTPASLTAVRVPPSAARARRTRT